jgi:hypothetical protein
MGRKISNRIGIERDLVERPDLEPFVIALRNNSSVNYVRQIAKRMGIELKKEKIPPMPGWKVRETSNVQCNKSVQTKDASPGG